jgi:ATP-binding cassette subfamily F protein 3
MRAGMVGPNGAGKSTLLRVLAGILPPEAGVVNRIGDIAYLPQDVTLPQGHSLLDIAMTPPPKLAEVEAELDAIESRLGDPDVYGDPDRLQAELDQQERALARYTALGGPSHRNRVLGLLHALGFDESEFDLPARALSGGQKKLVALVRLAVEAPSVLLLDEPDNHLDLRSKRYLERFIREYDGAVVIVSHDRYLLDETITHIVEMENGKLTVYHGNYTAYATQREANRLRQQQVYASQQKEVDRLKQQIAWFDHLARVTDDEKQARKARHRRRMLDRLENSGELVDKVTERRLMDLALDGGRGSQKALEVKALTMAFGDDPLFFDIDFLVRHGERVGLIGPNGAGKSVLFRLILGEMTPLSGDVVVGPSTRVGYYAQEHQTLSDWLKRTPVDLVRDVQAMPEGAAVNQLLRFAFTYEQTRQTIGTLSGGERSRLQLLRLMLMKPNLLLLDEPTNNLDIQSVEVLEAALEEFEGAVLAISHDRYFLDRMADRVLVLDDGALDGFLGGYTDYLEASGALSVR